MEDTPEHEGIDIDASLATLKNLRGEQFSDARFRGVLLKISPGTGDQDIAQSCKCDMRTVTFLLHLKSVCRGPDTLRKSVGVGAREWEAQLELLECVALDFRRG